MILTETHRELAAHEINNYSAISYCGTTGQGGVFILVRKDITHVPKIFNAPIDSVWTIVTINRIPILLGAVYIPPTSSPKLQTFISQLEEAAAFSTRHNLELLLAGDINARHPMWGDRSTNEHGRTLVNALHVSSRVLNVINDRQPTFVSTNGSSVILEFPRCWKGTNSTLLKKTKQIYFVKLFSLESIWRNSASTKNSSYT